MSLDLDLNYFENNFKVDKSSNNTVYRFGEFELNAAHLMLSRAGEEIPLVPKAVETLRVLVEQRGNILTKTELMDAIWADSIVEESNLAQYLHILRKTLGRQQNGQPYIETLRRRGYRFNGDVAVTERPRAAAPLPKLRKPQPVHDEAKVANAAPQPIRVERSDNIYSVIEWQHDRKADVAPATRRRSLTLPIVVLTIAAGLTAVGFAIYRGSYYADAQKKAVAVPFEGQAIKRLTSSGKTKRAAISPEGRYVAHVTEDADGSSLWIRQVTAASEIRIAGPSPSEFVWVGFGNDGNNVFYLSLDRDKGETELLRVPVLGGPPIRAAHDTGPVGFSPDGRSIAFFRMYDNGSRLIVAGVDGSNERVISSRREPEYFKMIWNAPAWSPDGKTIACPVHVGGEGGTYETLIGVELENGSEHPLTTSRLQNVGQPKWQGDGIMLTAAERTSGPQQIWHIALSDGTATRVTHDLSEYSDLSLTADGSKLAAVQYQSVSNFFVGANAAPADSKQIASEVGGLDDLAWTPDSRIVYISNAGGGGDIWIMDADGSNTRQLTAGTVAGRGVAVSPDGKHIVFSSESTGQPNLWRIGIDGADLTQLTRGDGEFYPRFTPDGNWIVFQRGEFDSTVWKIPADGGNSVRLSEGAAALPDVSVDGKFVVYKYLDSSLDHSRWSIGVCPLDGGPQTIRFDLPATAIHRFIRFAPDGQSIAFENTFDGASEIWAQPLDGGKPHRVAELKASNILSFDWSPDGRSFAMIRAVETSDVVLMTDVASAVTR